MVRPGGRPAVIGLFKSVAMVVTLMRANISKYGEMLAAVTGLFFFSNYYNPYE